ncbi:MAG: prepilin peptidase [Erysipelotrichaceae bacterium]|nr:prepilin peptidase [Erysipelotrichaceae bacterium]
MVWFIHTNVLNCHIPLLFGCGIFIGSFVNCISQRILLNEDWIYSRSRCDFCKHQLNMIDLIPVLSFLRNKGRCRYCHQKISIRYPLTELLTGVLFVIVYLHHPYPDHILIRDLILVCILLGLSLVDLDCFLIPNGFIEAGIINWLVSLFFVFDRYHYFLNGILGGVMLAGFVWLLMIIMDHILQKESMGKGDIKLLFMIGLYSGVYLGLWVLVIACLFGLISVLFTKKKVIPFGPCISAAAFIILIML